VSSSQARTYAEAPAPAASDQPVQAPKSAPARTPRRARLVLSRVDPWSVLKLSAVLSICLGIVFVVAVAGLWSVLDGMGVFDSVSKTVADVTRDANSPGTQLQDWLALPKVLTVAAGIAGVDAILLTALSTLSAFVYNVCSAVVGGLHVTLTEDS